ncbi:MAG: NAD(P)-dependent oxidoreductase [Phycisphaerales bacterium]|nr:NAD(P)-dependent oxidoreductase [Phycisphaerales bacterium]
MPIMRPIVIQTENLPQECSDWLAQRVDLHICPSDSLRFKELLPDASGIVIRTYTTVDEEMIASANNLLVVGRAGVGVDNIDLLACKNHKVSVVHTPQANSEAVVEFVLSVMLPLLRPVHKIATALDIDEWKLHRDASITQRQFDETTIGIIGFGKVGSRLGKATTALGFRVLFCDIQEIEEQYGCNQVDMETVIKESNVISVHVDGRVENHNFLHAGVFKMMKQGVVFINTSRGFVVSTNDLADHLVHNPSTTAVLDVHQPEPFTTSYPLLGKSNAVLYPHIAAKTETALKNMGWVVKDVYAVVRGEEPKYEATYPIYCP